MNPISQSSRLPPIERILNANLQVVFRFEEEDGFFFIRPEIHRDVGKTFEAKLKNIPSSFTFEQWERVQTLLRNGAIKCVQQTIEFPLLLKGGMENESSDEVEQLVDDSFAFNDEGLRREKEEDLVDRFNEAKKRENDFLRDLVGPETKEDQRKKRELKDEVSPLKDEIFDLIEEFPNLVALRRDPSDWEPLIRDMVRLSCSQDKDILTAILESFYSVLEKYPTKASLYSGLAEVLQSVAYHHSLDFVEIAQEVMEELRGEISYPPPLQKALEGNQKLKAKLQKINEKHKRSTFEKMSKAISKVADELESELAEVQKGRASKENQELFNAWQVLTDEEKKEITSSLKYSLSHFPSKFMKRVEEKALVDFNVLARLRRLICSSAQLLDLTVYSQTLLEAELSALNGIFWVMITHHYSNFNDDEKKELLSWAKQVKRRTLTTDKNTSRARANMTRRREFANPAIAFQAASLREALTRLATDTTKLKRISDNGIPAVLGLVAIGGLAAAAIAFAAPVAGVGVATAAGASGLEYYLENHASEVEGLPLDLRKGVTAGRELAHLGHPTSKHFWYETLHRVWIPLIIRASNGDAEALQSLQYEVKESEFDGQSLSDLAFLKMVYLLGKNDKKGAKEIKKEIWNPTFENPALMKDLILRKALEAKWQQTLREIEAHKPVGKPSDWWKNLPRYKKHKKTMKGEWNQLCDAVCEGRGDPDHFKPEESGLKFKEAEKVLWEELEAYSHGIKPSLQFEGFQPLIHAPLKEIEEIASGTIHRNRWYPLHGLVVAVEKHFYISSSQPFRVYALELLVSLNTEGHLWRKGKRASSARKKFRNARQFIELKLFKVDEVQKESYDQVFLEIEEVSEGVLQRIFWLCRSPGLQQLFREKNLVDPLRINTVSNELKKGSSSLQGLFTGTKIDDPKKEELANCYAHYCQNLVFPWLDVSLSLDDLFTTLVLLEKDQPQKDVELQDLFQEEKRRVLIKGAAGTGKTTLIDRLTNEWIAGRLFQEFDALYRLPFRELNLRKEELKQTDPHEWLAAAIDRVVYPDSTKYEEVLEFNRKNSEKILILLDGLDEADKEIVKRIGILLNPLLNFHVIISSRPGFGRSIVDQMEREVENIGFSNSQVEKFVQKLFAKLGKEREIFAFLRAIERVNPIVHTPLFLSMFCGLWIQGEGVDRSAFNSGVTTLYSTMIDQLHLWNVRKEDDDRDYAFIEQNVVKALGMIAKEGVERGAYVPAAIVGRVLQETQLQEEDIFSLGILHKTADRNHVSFLHPTFQEFLVAKWVSQEPELQTAFIQENRYQSHYQPVLSFLCGLSRDPDEFFAALDAPPTDWGGYYLLELQLRCLGENPCDHIAFETLFHLVQEWVEGNKQELDPVEWEVLYNLRTLFSYVQQTDRFQNFCRVLFDRVFENPEEDKISRACKVLALPGFFVEVEMVEKLLDYLQEHRYANKAHNLLISWSSRLLFTVHARTVLLEFLKEERSLGFSQIPLLENSAPLEEWEKERLFEFLDEKELGPVWEAIVSLLLDKPKNQEIEKEVYERVLELFTTDPQGHFFGVERIQMRDEEELPGNEGEFKTSTKRNRIVFAFIHMKNPLPKWIEERMLQLIDFEEDPKLALDVTFILAKKCDLSLLRPFVPTLIKLLKGDHLIHKVYAAAILREYSERSSFVEEEILEFINVLGENVLGKEDSIVSRYMIEILTTKGAVGSFTKKILKSLFKTLDSGKVEVFDILDSHYNGRSLEDWEFALPQEYMERWSDWSKAKTLKLLGCSKWTYSLNANSFFDLIKGYPDIVSKVLIQLAKNGDLTHEARTSLEELFQSEQDPTFKIACAEVLIEIIEPEEIKRLTLELIPIFAHMPNSITTKLLFRVFYRARARLGTFDDETLSKFFELLGSNNSSLIIEGTLELLNECEEFSDLTENQVDIMIQLSEKDPFGNASMILTRYFSTHTPTKSQVAQLLNMAFTFILFGPIIASSILATHIDKVDPNDILELMNAMELLRKARRFLNPFSVKITFFRFIPLRIIFDWFLKTEDIRFITHLHAQASLRHCPIHISEEGGELIIRIIEENKTVKCTVSPNLVPLVLEFTKLKYSSQFTALGMWSKRI